MPSAAPSRRWLRWLRQSWSRWLRRAASGLAVLGLALGLGALVPKPLPEPALPNLVLARPHRIEAGQRLRATHLVERLERLGYRRTRAARAGPGEYFHGESRFVIGRREFADAQGAIPAARLELRLSGERIAEVRGGDGAPLSHALLEPETLGALADVDPVDRVQVKLGELPRHLLDAVLTVEDKRFYEHHGLDPRRLAGALVANVRAKRVSQGGSTITQQLVKNVFLTHERSLVRKLREAWLALRVERAHTKDEILEAYLNTIYLGQRGPVSVVGVEAASRHYFGHSARTLDLGESALLAGMIRGPGHYSPFTHPERAKERRARVLAKLEKAGLVTAAEVAAAAKAPLGGAAKPPAAPRPAFFLAKLERDLAPHVDLEDERVRVFTGLDAQLQLEAERAVRRGLEELEKGYPRLRRKEQPLEAALVALEPTSGTILAYVGGRSFGASQFDRVAQMRRQPGSAFKPVVLLAALRRGAGGAPAFTLASLLDDAPLEVATPQGPWRPANYEKEFRGAVSLRRALEDSLNVPFVRVGLAVGPEAIVATAEEMGIESPLEPVPSLALGAGEVSPLELARAYALLANGGMRVAPLAALRVVDARGRERFAARPERERAFEPAEIALVTSALEGAVLRGTGAPLRALGYHGAAAGKTGTTNDGRDAWFVGYTPELVAAVWVGFDEGKPLGLTGARAALPIFARFLTAALGAGGGRAFDEPAGLERVAIHEPTGLRAGFLCWGESELFLTGTAPRERCGPGWLTRAPREAEPGDEEGEPRAPRRRREDPVVGFLRVLGDIIEEAARER